jgi:hypothetical protein
MPILDRVKPTAQLGARMQQKDLTPGEKAQYTAKWARTMTKWLITYTRRKGVRWNIVEFGGVTGSESRGIVDLLAGLPEKHST